MMCPPKLRVILLSLLSLAAGRATEPARVSDGSLCVHILVGTNRYSLNYFGHVCPHEGFSSLPTALFKDVASWAFNTSHYGLLSQLNRYRIYARLASLDDTEEHGRGFHGDYFETAEWAHDTDQAFLGLLDAKCPAAITAGLEKSLTQLHLASHQAGIIELTAGNTRAGARPLTEHDKRQLAAAFIDTEAKLLNEKSLSIVPKALDEVATDGNPPSEIEAARRYNLGKFALIE